MVSLIKEHTIGVRTNERVMISRARGESSTISKEHASDAISGPHGGQVD